MPVIRKFTVNHAIWQSIVKPYPTSEHFDKAIIEFHKTCRTNIHHLPYLLGKKVNLKELFIAVMKHGGFKRVNESDEWEEILEELNIIDIPTDSTISCTNSDTALQMIYVRYLEQFERQQYIYVKNQASNNNFDNGGNSNDSFTSQRDITKLEELSQQDKSISATIAYENTPKIYSDSRQLINTSLRASNGLSCDLKPHYELKHLLMSLSSGLENEIELALNTLLIISASSYNGLLGQYLSVRDCGDLLDLLVGVTGVISTKKGHIGDQFMETSWMKTYLQFWNNEIEDEVGRLFLIPNIFDCTKSEFDNLLTENRKQDSKLLLFNDQSFHSYPTSQNCLRRFETVATILYNLSIDSPVPSNTPIIPKVNDSATLQSIAPHHTQLLRFIFLCLHSKRPILRRLSIQILSRLSLVLPDDSGDFDPPSWLPSFILSLLDQYLIDSDRVARISACELLQSLCLREPNHRILQLRISNSQIINLASLLVLNDIQPICSALESLLALSQLGETLCRRMANIHQLLRTLLVFIKLEAQVFGREAVYRVKTYNYRPPHQPNPAISAPSTPFLQHRMPFVPQSPSHQSQMTPYSPSFPRPNMIYQSPSPRQASPVPSPQYPLTPLQHINSLVNRSFTTSPQNSSTSPLEKIIQNDNSAAMPDSSQNAARKIVKIKCFSEEEPICNGTGEISPKPKCNGLINGSKSSILTTAIEHRNSTQEDRELKIELVENKSYVPPPPTESTNQSKDQPNLNSTSSPVNKSHDPSVEFQRSAFIEGQKNANKTPLSIKIDNGSVSDNDSEKMPPPSLPTPSMLKRKRSSTNLNSPINTNSNIQNSNNNNNSPPNKPPTNGLLSSIQNAAALSRIAVLQMNNADNKHDKLLQLKMSSEMTFQSNAQIEDRSYRAKKWLQDNFRVKDKGFVLKNDLVNALNTHLQEPYVGYAGGNLSPNKTNSRLLSTTQLHACIKEVFGPEVQVKGEGGSNGTSRLIYSNLVWKTDEDKNPQNELDSNHKQNDGELANLVPKNILPPIKINGNLTNGDSEAHSPNKKLCTEKDVSLYANTPNGITTVKSPPINGIIKNLQNHDKIDSNDNSKNDSVNINDVNHRPKENDVHNKSDKKLRVKCKDVDPIPFKVRKLIIRSRYRTHVYFKKQRYKINGSNDIKVSLDKNNNDQDNATKKSDNSACSDKIEEPVLKEGIICEWEGCGVKTACLQEHLSKVHLQMSSQTTYQCKWGFFNHPSQWKCQLSRPMLSLVCHIQDVHLSGISQNNLQQHQFTQNPQQQAFIVQQQIQQLQNNSANSILRQQFVQEQQSFYQNELPEGPITKHIRISAAIILRNMCQHSIVAKEFLQIHKSYLVGIAMSNEDCSRIIIQILDLLDPPKPPTSHTMMHHHHKPLSRPHFYPHENVPFHHPNMAHNPYMHSSINKLHIPPHFSNPHLTQQNHHPFQHFNR